MQYTDDRCALLSIQAILKRIRRIFDGEDETTCRRASSAQQQLLTNFTEIIQDQYESVAPPDSEIVKMIRVSVMHAAAVQVLG